MMCSPHAPHAIRLGAVLSVRPLGAGFWLTGISGITVAGSIQGPFLTHWVPEIVGSMLEVKGQRRSGLAKLEMYKNPLHVDIVNPHNETGAKTLTWIRA